MKERCYKVNNKGYKNYGGRGITCEWNTFEDFKNDMYDSYLDHVSKYGEKQTTIDRIDGNGNYCKENCRWATCTEQNKNRYITNYIQYNGKKYSAWEVAEECGISRKTASYRISGYKQGKQSLESVFRK